VVTLAQPRTRRGEVDITVQVPNEAPAGCFVPVALLAAPSRASNFVTMVIGPQGRACDAGPLPQPRDEKLSLAVFTRSMTRAIREGVLETIRDDARVSFEHLTVKEPVSPVRPLPPPGTCTVYTGTYETKPSGGTSLSTLADVPAGFWGVESEGGGLDAGD
jgi:hypothetical protein